MDIFSELSSQGEPSQEEINNFFESDKSVISEEDIKVEDKPEEESTEVDDLLDEKPTKKNSKNDEDEIKKLEDDFFNSDEDVYEENSEDENKPKASKEKPSNTDSESVTVLNYLAKKGLIDLDEEDEEEITPDKAEELLEDNLDLLASEKLRTMIEEKVPTENQKIVKYLMNGGSIDELVETVKSKASLELKPDMELDDEKTQERVLRSILKEEGISDDEIDGQIEYYKDNGRLDKIAKSRYDRWEKSYSQKQEELLRQREEQIRKQKEIARKEKAELKELLSSNNEIGGIKLNRADKKELIPYLLDTDIKLDNGAVVSKFQHDLMKLLNSRKAVIQLAKIVKNTNKDGSLNLENIINTAKSEYSREVRNNITRAKTTPRSSSTSSPKRSEDILDLFS